jgi:hypothetical protein
MVDTKDIPNELIDALLANYQKPDYVQFSANFNSLYGIGGVLRAT